jgi:hypothetical protein
VCFLMMVVRMRRWRVVRMRTASRCGTLAICKS